MVVYCRRNGLAHNRVGYTVSTKREIYRLNSHQLKIGWDIVIVARSRCVGAEYSRMDAAFMAACEKLSIRREAKP